MYIDKSAFLYLTGAIATGGAVGYFLGHRNLEKPVAIDHSPPVVTSPVVAAAPPAPKAPEPPPCDDNVAVLPDCPPVGYSAEEGGCGALPMKRCNDFKQTFKPRVAERAVACINALKPNEQCQTTRLALCGHSALMSACPDTTPHDGGPQPQGGVEATCATILRGCDSTGVAPSRAECEASLAGMNIVGRTAMVQCMKAHCADKGLVGCEGVLEQK